MKSFRLFVFMLAAFCACVSFSYSQPQPQIEVSGRTYSYGELQSRVDELLHSGNVELRRNVELVFTLAQRYEEQGKKKEAIELYDKALEVNAWNLAYQLRLAYLLKDTERKEESAEKALLVREYAEDEELIEDAEAFLAQMGVDFTEQKEPLRVNKKVEIVLIPLGEVNMRVLGDLQYALKKLVGIKFSIAGIRKDAGVYDRDMSERYVDYIFTSIASGLAPAQKDILLSELKLDKGGLRTQENKRKFIYAYFRKLGREEAVKSKERFEEILAESRSKGQYDAARLIGQMKRDFPIKGGSAVQGYLAVTGEDIYEGQANFLFGAARPGYGVMSYHRFSAAFTKENQNRPRLIKRALKQAASSVFFILGIPRCNNPLCVRAYPHSLTELDEKPDTICPLCARRLKEYLAGHL